MKYNSEIEFELYIRGLIKKNIIDKLNNFVLLENKKAVDILICRQGAKPALFFIEVKYHKEKHGRLGFGSSNGGGFQPEIVSKKPSYFETNLRWVIGRQTNEKTGIIFVSSNKIREYVSGGNVGKKFNNIQQRIFREITGYSEQDFIKELESWLIKT